MADAAGLHELESPFGFSKVIRCLNNTGINPINETTHTELDWLKERGGTQRYLDTSNRAATLSTSAQRSANHHWDPFHGASSPPSKIHAMTIEHLFKGSDCSSQTGGLSSAFWLTTTLG